MKFINSTIGKSIIFTVACSLSFAGGIAVEKIFTKKNTKSIATLRIDRSEEDEPPKIFLELEAPFEELQKMETASIKILNKNYI